MMAKAAIWIGKEATDAYPDYHNRTGWGMVSDSVQRLKENGTLDKIISGTLERTIPLTEAYYNRLVTALNTLLDNGAADETHVLAPVADVIGDLIEAWETAHVPELGE
jgi:hypothetical protein